MNLFYALPLLLLAAGCTSKKNPPETPPPVDNAVTRYTDNLQQSVEKAREAADVANERIRRSQETYQNIND